MSQAIRTGQCQHVGKARLSNRHLPIARGSIEFRGLQGGKKPEEISMTIEPVPSADQRRKWPELPNREA